jgi:hypothetical protein
LLGEPLRSDEAETTKGRGDDEDETTKGGGEEHGSSGQMLAGVCVFVVEYCGLSLSSSGMQNGTAPSPGLGFSPLGFLFV